MVVSTEYYDLLGVSPTATDEEIRRGYLRQARQWHPDKCGGSPEAESRFKEINDAWKVLSDPQLRHIYDTSGKEGTSKAREQAGIDPVATTMELCRALFGFGKFQTLFGDPTTFPMFVMAMKMMERSATTGKEIDTTAEIRKSLDKEQYKQAEVAEEKEIDELVVYLKQKLSFVTRGKDHKKAFADLCASEAEFLSNSPGGDELIGTIGYVYAQEAKQHSSRLFGMEALAAEVAEKGHVFAQKMELLGMAVKLLSISTQLQREVERQEMLKDKANPNAAISNKPSSPAPGSAPAAPRQSSPSPAGPSSKPSSPAPQAPSSSASPGASATPADTTNRPSSAAGGTQSGGQIGGGVPMDNVDDSGDFTEAQQALMEKMLTQGLSAMWTLGKFLVEQRVRRVCEGVFKGLRTEEKRLYVDALAQMGEVYERTSAKMKRQRVLNDDIKDEAQEAFGLPKFR